MRCSSSSCSTVLLSGGGPAWEAVLLCTTGSWLLLQHTTAIVLNGFTCARHRQQYCVQYSPCRQATN
jgi:hypothetical protein